MRVDDIPELLLTFYGDDFTGSTDAMEALAFNGIKTVLFLEPPSRELLQKKFKDVRAIGLAGVSRAMGIKQMDEELKPLMEEFARIPSHIVHYKMCSTFDSSPTVGSIGRVIDMGMEMIPCTDKQKGYVPLLVGAPVLKRYTIFGHHFATVGETTYRLDRHPTMSRHPVTPMDEADLCLHLAKQTNKSIINMDIHDLTGSPEQVQKRLANRLKQHADIVLFDVLDDERLKAAARIIWEGALEQGNRWVVGSSGIEYGLAMHWKEQGISDPANESLLPIEAVNQILVVSGSCSPVTEGQIRYALSNGFVGVAIPAERLIMPGEADKARRQLVDQAISIIQSGLSPLLYTALGPEDASIGRIQSRLTMMGYQAADSGRLLGEQLGLLTKEILERSGLRRFVIAGGDTSGFVTRQLGIYALEAVMPVASGGPLCEGYSVHERFDHIQFVLKGGQVGKENFFAAVREAAR